MLGIDLNVLTIDRMILISCLKQSTAQVIDGKNLTKRNTHELSIGNEVVILENTNHISKIQGYLFLAPNIYNMNKGNVIHNCNVIEI